MTAAAKEKYSPAAMLLHWLIAILVIVNWRLVEAGEHAPKSEHEAIMGNHFAFGIVILGLALLRIVVRIASPPPPLASHLRPWEAVLARIVHGLLALLIVVMPLLGWVAMSLYGQGIHVFGLFTLPALPLEANKDLAKGIFEAHGVLGTILVILMFVHILAVIKHMAIDRDGNLFRMLPFGKVRV